MFEILFFHGESVGSCFIDFQMFRCLQLYLGDGVCGASLSKGNTQ